METFQHLAYSDKSAALLAEFVEKLGAEGAAKFRYFQKRPFEVIKNHLVTVLVTDEKNAPLAYGHLEPEGGFLWLGIAVAESARGKGLGKKMMAHLIEQAKKNNESAITLTVDNDNQPAIRLYEQLGFVALAQKETYTKYELKLS